MKRPVLVPFYFFRAGCAVLENRGALSKQPLCLISYEVFSDIIEKRNMYKKKKLEGHY